MVLIILNFILTGLTSCSKVNQEFQKGEGDMMYRIIGDKDGENIREDDFISMNYTERTENDSLISGSSDYDRRPTLMFKEKSGFKGDLFAALGMLSEGDSAIFKINIDSIKKTGRQLPIDIKGKYLVYNVKINKVITRAGMSDSLLNSQIEELRKTEMDNIRDSEASNIHSYLSVSNLKPSVTSSGLCYVINNKGEGIKAVAGDTVRVNYTASTLGGKIVETTTIELAKKAGIFNRMLKYEPRDVSVETGKSLSGFQEALLLLPKGSSATLIIPSRLAYGAQGRNNIQPYTPLICKIDILDINHPKIK